MTVLSPIWLYALIPWAALVAWVLTGRRERRRVPFLKLWDAPDDVRRPKRKAVEPPPLGVALLLLACLAGVLAAAGPVIGRGPKAPVMHVVVDRGASMSALADGKKTRFAAAAQALAQALRARGEPVLVGYHVVPGGEVAAAEPGKFVEHVGHARRTARTDTRDALRSVVRAVLESHEAVVVISDQDLGLADERVIRVGPEGTPPNLGIESLSARAGQVMVRVRSTGAATRTLRVASGGRTVERKLELSGGGPTDVFVDLPDPAEVIEARLVEADAFDGDDRAWSVRPSTWPVVTAWAPVGEEARRVLEVYAKHRPAGEGGRRVVVVRAGDDLGAEESAVLLAADAAVAPSGGAVTTTEHPVVSGVDLSPLGSGTAVAAKPPGEGWTVVARLADKPVVAVREAAGVRRVWVGFESREFARTPGFVVFWGKVLDWVGNGSEEYVSRAVGELPAEAVRMAPDPLPADVEPPMWPGLFRTADGLVAVNAGVVEFPAAAGADDWRARIARMRLSEAGGVELRRWLALTALALAAVAAAVWERSRRTGPPVAAPPAALNRAIA